MVISRKSFECNIQVNNPLLTQVEKVQYLGMYFTSDGRPDTEISVRVDQAGVVMRQLGWSVARRHEVSRLAKLSVFRAVFMPNLTYGHEIMVTERIRSRMQAAEMRFLRAKAGVTRLDRVRNTVILEELQTEQLLLRIERSILRWYGHWLWLPPNRLVRKVLEELETGYE